MTTALILRDPKTPKIRVLEVDGPNPAVDPIINYSPRMNLPPLSFEEWLALPDHDKKPRYENPSVQDFSSARRVAALITANLPYSRIKIEILARLELLFPCCTEDYILDLKLTLARNEI
jgi:hypothetical protein